MQLAQVFEVGQAQVAVQLAGTDVEDAGHGEALHAREHAGRSDGDFRCHEGHLVADTDAQLGRSLVADHQAEFAGPEVIDPALLDESVDDRDVVLLRRIDAIEQNLLDLPVMGQQTLHLSERRDRRHLRVSAGPARPGLASRRWVGRIRR